MEPAETVDWGLVVAYEIACIVTAWNRYNLNFLEISYGFQVEVEPDETEWDTLLGFLQAAAPNPNDGLPSLFSSGAWKLFSSTANLGLAINNIFTAISHAENIANLIIAVNNAPQCAIASANSEWIPRLGFINAASFEAAVGQVALVTSDAPSPQFGQTPAPVFAFSMAVGGTNEAEVICPYLDPNLLEIDESVLIDAGGGDDTICGSVEDDAIYAGDGNDIIEGRGGQDFLVGGQGNDTYVLTRDTFSVVINDRGAASDIDVVRFADLTRADVEFGRVDLTSDDFYVRNLITGRYLIIVDGLVDATRGVEQFVFSDGEVVSLEEALVDAIVWSPIDGFQFDDRTITATSFDDVVLPYDVASEISTYEGNDHIDGGEGDDTLLGGQHDDFLSGGWGNDYYLYEAGDGHDEVADAGIFTETDTLIFGEGIHPDVILAEIENDGHDLRLRFSDQEGSILLREAVADPVFGDVSNHRIERVEFHNGESFEVADLIDLANTMTDGDDVYWGYEASSHIFGLAGNDTIFGRNGADTIVGGLGNDLLHGGNGADVYIVHRGDGHDTILEHGVVGGTNRLVFGPDIELTDLSVSYSDGGNDYVLEIDNLTSVRLDELSWTPLGPPLMIEGFEISFTSGAVLGLPDLQTMANVPTSHDDYIYGSDSSDSLEGLAGNDLIDGRYGDNLIDGGLGDDHIVASFGNDTIIGGLGADLIEPGNGDNVILLESDEIYASGYAALNVSSFSQTGTEAIVSVEGMTSYEVVIYGGFDADTIELSDGSDAFFLHDSFSDFHEEVFLLQDSEGRPGAARLRDIDMIMAGAGNDIIDLTSPDYEMYGAMTVDGGEGDDTIWGSQANDILLGQQGDDVLFGGTGVDVLTGGAGADVFEFTRTSTDTSVTDFRSSDGDVLRFYNSSGAVFESSSVTLTDQGILISYGDAASGTTHDITIDLALTPAEFTVTLPEILNALEIV